MPRSPLLALLLLSSCLSPRPPAEISQELPALEVFHVTNLQQKYDIRLDHASTYYNPGIGGLCLRYTSEELFDICDARNLLVDLVDSLLRRVALDPGVGGALTSPPLKVEDLDIIITFDSFFGEYVDEQFVNQIKLKDGVVRYFAFSAFDCLTDYFEKHREPYHTAQLNSSAYRMAGHHPAKAEMGLEYDRKTYNQEMEEQPDFASSF